MRVRVKPLFWTLAVAVGLGACARSPGRSATPTVLSRSLNGSAILREKCTLCHDLGGLGAYSGSWGQTEWRSMIETMVAYGARLTETEVDMLAVYLGIHFGTGGSPAEAPTRDESGNSDVANLLQSACTTCHDLSVVVSTAGAYSEAEFRIAVDRMIAYGAAVPGAQVEPLVEYLVEVYGR